MTTARSGLGNRGGLQLVGPLRWTLIDRYRTLLTLAARWLVVLVTTALAFHRTLDSVADDIAAGTLSYVLVVPLFALLAVAAHERHGYTTVAIHDRETDFIVGGIIVVMSLAAVMLLGPQLAGVYFLWRVDLLMLVSFTFGSSVLLFGLRPTVRHRYAWLVLTLLWPLPMRLAVFTLGQGHLATSAALQLVVVLVLLLYARRPANWRRAVLTVALAAGLGLAALVVIDVDQHPDRQMLPAVLAAAVGVASWALERHSTRPFVQPVVAAPRAALSVLVVAAVAGATFIAAPPSADSVIRPEGITATVARPEQLVPSGWVFSGEEEFTSSAGRYFGPDATFYRYRLHATGPSGGKDAVDAKGLRRDLVVDVLTSSQPRSFALYPVVTTYPTGTLELSPASRVALGHGLVGQLYSAVDSDRQLTWSMLTFSWQLPAPLAIALPPKRGPLVLSQRVTVMSVDDHRPDAPFPGPSNALADSVRAALSQVVRGSARTN
ncbi:MAG TPA: hypothetical protein VF635_02635, partial [Propionibacteriaceae bacterium]